MIKLKFLLVILFSLGLSQVSVGQETKKRILVVPFSQYQFFSSFNLQEISSINALRNPSGVAQLIIDSLMANLSKPHARVEMIQMPETEYVSLSHLLNATSKADPVPHYGVNQEIIWKNTSFQGLLKNYQVDYVLFLTHYVLEKKLLTTNRSFDGSFLIKWSNHKLHYELYDLEGNMQVYSNGFELNPDNPTNETFLFKGLKIQYMSRGFRSVRKDLLKKMEQYKATGKPVFRLKREKKKKKSKK